MADDERILLIVRPPSRGHWKHNMPADLSKSLVIGISSRALFDLEEANSIHDEQGLAAYSAFMQKNEGLPLGKGSGFDLVKAILDLNGKISGHRPCEVVIMSKNSPATSFCLFNSVAHYELEIERAVLAGGARLAPYLRAFSVDLYLSADEVDVRAAIDAKIAAAVIYPTPSQAVDPRKEIRIAFDGDAVLFSDEAERIYKDDGFEAFIEHEKQKAREQLPEGPFARLLHTLSVLQKDSHFTVPPIRTALVTARSMPSHMRVLNTLRAWDVHVDEAFFMGGVEKTEILRAFNPHIFFDDQHAHCSSASGFVSTGHVPYGVANEPKVVANSPETKVGASQTKRGSSRRSRRSSPAKPK
jgi:5'-nucleotidase